jgi:hypothetical protein
MGSGQLDRACREKRRNGMRASDLVHCVLRQDDMLTSETTKSCRLMPLARQATAGTCWLRKVF